MDISAGWQIGLAAATITGSGALNLWLISWRMGKREGTQAKAIHDLEVWRRDEERRRIQDGKAALAERDRIANQFLRQYQAIEQLRRLHKTGNGGINWTDLTGG